MLFHEIYGSYYDATAAVLREAVKGTLTPGQLRQLVQEKAFSESVLTVPRGLQGEQWRLLRGDLSTPLVQPPTMPLTLLQKRWLKALLLDPRIRLFAPDTAGLEDVEPLFTPDMFVLFDRYADGDDYADPAYAVHFREVIRALREQKDLYLRYESSRKHQMTFVITPHHLEYSEKDDRFRLMASNQKRNWCVNLSGILECAAVGRRSTAPYCPAATAQVTFELLDYRNALERVLLHFSHLEKETERLDDKRYRVTLRYDTRDETELVIRILSFGPVIRVLSPDHFVALVKQRIDRQMALARPTDPGGDLGPEKNPAQ